VIPVYFREQSIVIPVKPVTFHLILYSDDGDDEAVLMFSDASASTILPVLS
jgi:hypothetical protein